MTPSMTALANALIQARQSNQTLDATSWLNTLETADQAYEVQDAVASALAWFGGQTVPRYWKSGGASRSATLTHAPLPPAGVRTGPADFSDMAFHVPGIEAEIALRLGQDVTPAMAAKLDHGDAASLIDAMAVSVEIVDSRWQDLAATPALLRLADSQVHGALAIGEWQPYAAVDWASQRCETKSAAPKPWCAKAPIRWPIRRGCCRSGCATSRGTGRPRRPAPSSPPARGSASCPAAAAIRWRWSSRALARCA